MACRKAGLASALAEDIDHDRPHVRDGGPLDRVLADQETRETRETTRESVKPVKQPVTHLRFGGSVLDFLLWVINEISPGRHRQIRLWPILS